MCWQSLLEGNALAGHQMAIIYLFILINLSSSIGEKVEECEIKFCL